MTARKHFLEQFSYKVGNTEGYVVLDRKSTINGLYMDHIHILLLQYLQMWGK